jgi:hypothetical protein
MIMKNLLFSIIVVVLPLLFYQCSQTNSNPFTSAVDTKSISISIATNEGFDTIARKAIVTVSGKDMEMFASYLTITHNSITGTIKDIPVGKDRFFEITVFGNTEVPIYYGSAYADIQLGQITYVNITLQKLSGGMAIINGTIEENSNSCKEVYITGLNVASVYVDKINNILNVGLSAWAKTNNGDPVEFSWTIYGIDEKITQIDWSKDAGNVKLVFPMNGKVQAIVYARCAIHNKVMATDTLNLLITDGVVTEEAIPGGAIEFVLLNIANSFVIPEKKLVETSLVTAVKSTSGSPVEYRWELYYDDGSQITNWDVNDSTQTVFTPLTCYLKGSVMARDAKNPDLTATAWLSLTIEGGKITNFYSSANSSQKPLSIGK